MLDVIEEIVEYLDPECVPTDNEEVKKEMDAHKEASETSINAMREMFCDWSHMSMKKQVMEGLKSAISRKFEAAMGGTDEPVAINCKEAVLMDQ